ncbi:MAG: hypothetical protein RLZZ618_3095 [Pseudomonadota bacterium]
MQPRSLWCGHLQRSRANKAQASLPSWCLLACCRPRVRLCCRPTVPWRMACQQRQIPSPLQACQLNACRLLWRLAVEQPLGQANTWPSRVQRLEDMSRSQGLRCRIRRLGVLTLLRISVSLVRTRNRRAPRTRRLQVLQNAVAPFPDQKRPLQAATSGSHRSEPCQAVPVLRAGTCWWPSRMPARSSWRTSAACPRRFVWARSCHRGPCCCLFIRAWSRPKPTAA